MCAWARVQRQEQLERDGAQEMIELSTRFQRVEARLTLLGLSCTPSVLSAHRKELESKREREHILSLDASGWTSVHVAGQVTRAAELILQGA